MSKRLTTQEFIDRANIIHEYSYDYSKTEYTSSTKKVVITCPIHGDFEQRASHHLRGHGCPKCNHSKNGLLFGIGLNDIQDKTRSSIAYIKWKNMLRRCYDNSYHIIYPTYKECVVCEEWHKLSNFKRWFDENYIKGYELDKDILVKGNKVYSPETCCFVPSFINRLIANSADITSELVKTIAENSYNNKQISEKVYTAILNY